jgi:hypothetical protein
VPERGKEHRCPDADPTGSRRHGGEGRQRLEARLGGEAVTDPDGIHASLLGGASQPENTLGVSRALLFKKEPAGGKKETEGGPRRGLFAQRA